MATGRRSCGVSATRGISATCPADQTIRSSLAHTSAASVPDLRQFVHAVLDYTGAEQVDIVAHSLGGTVAREWLRQDDAHSLVRRLVTVASPHHGIINCSPSPENYWQLPASGGFVPTSAVCVELGAMATPFLSTLNAGDETPGPTRYLTIRYSDTDFVYLSFDDGGFPAVPALDRNGAPADFAQSPALDRGDEPHTRRSGDLRRTARHRPSRDLELTRDVAGGAGVPPPQRTVGARPHVDG